MTNLISRQDTQDLIDEYIETAQRIKCKDAEDMLMDLADDVRNLPSAEPERKKGKWLRYGEDGYPNEEDTVFWQCDQCLETYTGRTTRIPNYCPHCGADMRGEEDA